MALVVIATEDFLVYWLISGRRGYLRYSLIDAHNAGWWPSITVWTYRSQMTSVIIVNGRETARLIHQSLVTATIDEPSWDTEFWIKEVEKKALRV